MSIEYDAELDTLTITLGPDYAPLYHYEAGDVTATTNDGDLLIQVSIANARQFLRRALLAGLSVPEAPKVEPPENGMVWQGVDSSMISAFGYDEVSGTLEVAFNRTGVYRYFKVPAHVVEELRQASSHGSYMRNYIIDYYDYEKK